MVCLLRSSFSVAVFIFVFSVLLFCNDHDCLSNDSEGVKGNEEKRRNGERKILLDAIFWHHLHSHTLMNVSTEPVITKGRSWWKSKHNKARKIIKQFDCSEKTNNPANRKLEKIQ